MSATIPPAAASAAQIAVVSENWAAAGAPARPSAPIVSNATALSDQRIKDAVAATIAAAADKPNEAPATQAALRSTVFGAENTAFAKQIANAKVPGCMGADGLKFQPPQLGPIVFSGVFTLPFLLVAAARGKCK